MPYLDYSVFWQEVAKWFAGIAASLATLFLLGLRWWAGDRFQEMNDRLDEHDEAIDNHEGRLSDHHETMRVVLVHIDNGKEERQRIESNVKELRKENQTSFQSINEKLDRIVERK